MGREGLMTPEEAERKIWEFYWQMDQAIDRRTAPVRYNEPPDRLDQDEHEARYTGLFGQLQRRIDEGWDRVKRRGERLFGRRREKYEEQVAAEELRGITEEDTFQASVRKARGQKGMVDHGTGLPMDAGDLAVGRGVVSGVDLCLESILPPMQLAAACTAWLPPCPSDESPETWGNEIEHWQVMAAKDRDLQCDECEGKGSKVVEVTSRSSGGLILIRRETSKKETIPCDKCGGRGAVPNWTQEETDTVRQNAFQIQRAAHRLAEEGYFDIRPINERDAEMHDLVWEDKTGHTIGFRMTYNGYQRMKQMVEEDEELRSTVRQHLLAVVGREKREAAPEWARREYEDSK